MRKVGKKILCTILAAGMMVSMTGCGGGNSGGKSDAIENPYATGKNPGTFDEGKLTIWFMNEGENYDKVLKEFENRTRDTLNTKLDIHWTTDHKTEMPLKFIAKEDCDITFDAYWMNMGKNIKDGTYSDLSKYLDNPEFPGLQKVFTRDVIDSVRYEDGGVYCLPLFNSYSEVRCMYIRGDWREKYNLPKVTDDDTFEQYLKCMEEHKKELGIDAPLLLGNRGFFYFGYDFYKHAEDNVLEVDSSGARVTQQFDVVLNDDATKVISVNAVGDRDEQFADNPEPYNTNYRNQRILDLADRWGKYVVKDALNVTDGDKKFKSGLYAATEGTLAGAVGSNVDLKKYDKDAWLEEYIYEPEMRNMQKTVANAAIANNFICIPAYSKNIDRAMAFIDWVYQSQENYDLFALGIEGEDWKEAENGSYTPLDSSKKYSFPVYELAYSAVYERIPDTYSDEERKCMEYAMNPDNFTQNPLAGFRFDNTATPELKSAYAAYTTLQQDYYSYFMLGSYGKDTQKKLDEFYEKGKDNMNVIRNAITEQLQAYLDSQNAQ